MTRTLPTITGRALECAELRLDAMSDEHPARILRACAIEEGGAAEFLNRCRVDMAPGLEDAHPDVPVETALDIVAAGLLSGVCVGVLAVDHAAGHPDTRDRGHAAGRMTDLEVDAALASITSAVARHQGAGADTPDGLVESLRGLADVRAVFREVTGIGAPR